jgi:hypothetical protein
MHGNTFNYLVRMLDSKDSALEERGYKCLGIPSSIKGGSN